MPQYFHFSGPDVLFNAPLQCEQCTFMKSNGERCRRNVCIGLDVCWSHLPHKYKVKMGTSLIPNSGKGLFAHDMNAASANAIVFKVNQTICPYNGEIINENQLNQRYGQYTAPYGLQTRQNPPRYEDGALRRGVGTLINHKPVAQANARLTYDSRTGRGLIKATKNIRQGKELYVSYGNDFRMNEPTQYSTNNRMYQI